MSLPDRRYTFKLGSSALNNVLNDGTAVEIPYVATLSIYPKDGEACMCLNATIDQEKLNEFALAIDLIDEGDDYFFQPQDDNDLVDFVEHIHDVTGDDGFYIGLDAFEKETVDCNVEWTVEHSSGYSEELLENLKSKLEYE